MQKLFLLFTVSFLCYSGFSQNTRNWDKFMQMQRCSIHVKADLFTATTFIEMEFYNPNNQEVEGLYQFQLQPGQAITAFQLDLHGQYRDGSIEEKWKAANAYNTIVGKRIDPALLQMDSYNNYSLRIYPIAAKSTRKVTMTIQQLLKINNESLEYYLPLNVRDTVRSFKAEIVVSNSHAIPYIKDGLLTSNLFSGTNVMQKLAYTASDLLLNKPIAFHIPLFKNSVVCTQQVIGNTYFAVRMSPSFQKTYSVSPKKIKVYWDVSASGNKRNTNKEINFLKQYIAYHNIQEMEITTFNFKIQDSQNFIVDEQNGKWASYLRELEYEGATQIGCIDLSQVSTDAVFLFSDGNNSYGNALPKRKNQYIYCVHASDNTDNIQLDKIVGESGGNNIDLLKVSMHEAIQMGSSAENMLMDIRSASGKSIINFQHHYKDQNILLITGITGGASDSLIFFYGNNNRASGKEMIVLNAGACLGFTIDRIQTLAEFGALIKTNAWQEILYFGKEQKVVTPNTSYIVLERIEDYVKYQIEPPKELEDECAKMGFVKADKQKKLHQHSKLTEYQILNGVVQTYNARMKNLDDESLISLSIAKPDNGSSIERSGKQDAVSAITSTAPGLIAQEFSNNLDEVVVTGYSMQKRSSLTGTITVIRANEIHAGSTSVEQILSGRVAGVSITPANNFQIGDLSSIRIRVMSSLANNNQPLFIVDGMPVSDNINNFVNTNEIESIEILKDASATTIYGSRGGNGVIHIKTKRGRSFNNFYSEKPYKLSEMEDMEYLQEIKGVAKDQKWNKKESKNR